MCLMIKIIKVDKSDTNVKVKNENQAESVYSLALSLPTNTPLVLLNFEACFREGLL